MGLLRIFTTTSLAVSMFFAQSIWGDCHSCQEEAPPIQTCESCGQSLPEDCEMEHQNDQGPSEAVYQEPPVYYKAASCGLFSTSNWYLLGYGSFLQPLDSRFYFENGRVVDTSWGAGSGWGLILGTKLWERWDLELEYARRSSDLKKAVGVSGIWLWRKTSGDFTSHSVMVNFLYPVDCCAKSVKPFVGLGMGGANLNLKTDNETTTGVPVIDVSDRGFAYQVMAGFKIPCGGWEFMIRGVFFGTSEFSFAAEDDSGKARVSYHDVSINGGLGFHF